jgi:hypothetical protein
VQKCGILAGEGSQFSIFIRSKSMATKKKTTTKSKPKKSALKKSTAKKRIVKKGTPKKATPKKSTTPMGMGAPLNMESGDDKGSGDLPR